MATSPKIMYGSTQITTVKVNGTEMYDVNVVKDGTTTRVYHKHTSACYSGGHTHTDACYSWLNWGLCGGCNYEYSGFVNHEPVLCPNCGLYYIAEKESVTCGQAESKPTLICGYNV